MSRPIRALIDASALAHNLRTLKLQNPDKLCMAVVKADAYGHRLNWVLPGLEGADALAILELNKATELRRSGWKKPIVLLEGCFNAEEFRIALEHRLDWVIHNRAQLDQVINLPPQSLAIYKPRVFLKLNTGMNRLGFTPAQAPTAIVDLEQWRLAHACPVPVLMTHFANADLPDGQDNGLSPQLQHQSLMALKPESWMSSLGNSAAALNWPALAGDVFRPGIAVYGASPGPRSASDYGLQAVMSLHTEVIALQHVQAGERVGYGSRWLAPQASTIAVIACGYADGYPRHAPDGTPVMIQGQLGRLAGRVSMDMMTVDVTGLSQVTVGSPVELWGKSLPVDEVAGHAGTISYELLCAVAPRVPFRKS